MKLFNKKLSSTLAISILLSSIFANFALLEARADATSIRTSTGKAEKLPVLKRLGLSAKAYRLINQGDWKNASEEISASTTSATKGSAWLAFAYFYLGKCDDLDKLSSSLGDAKDEDSEKQMARVLVIALNDLCQKKFDDAYDILSAFQKLSPAQCDQDMLFNFCLAAVYAKKQNQEMSEKYCAKALELAPDFAWGYRTDGMLFEKSLNKPSLAIAQYRKALMLEPNFSEARDLLVNLLLVRNNFDDAIEIAQQGIKASSHSANNYFRLAQIYIEQWRLKEALKLLDKAIYIAHSESPSSARYHHAKASILRYQGDMPEAILEQEKAVAVSKDKAFELIELAHLNALAENANRACDNLKEALSLDPKNHFAHEKLVELLLAEKSFSDLEAEYARIIALEPNDSNHHVGLARVLIAAGKPDQAINELKQASQLNESNAFAYQLLGGIYLEKKDYGKAAKEYTKALNINPGSLSDLIALGYAYKMNGDYMQAETALVTAIALKQLNQTTGSASGKPANDPAPLLRELGDLFIEEGRYIEASQQFEAITALDKDQTDQKQLDLDRFRLAQANLLRDRTQAMSRTFVQAFEKLPFDVQSQRAKSAIKSLLTAGRTQSAQALFEKFKASQNDFSWTLLQAEILRAQGALKEARTQAMDVATNSTDDSLKARAFIQLALLSLENKDAAQARTYITKSLEITTKSAEAYNALARISLSEGKHGDAIEQAKLALEVNPYFAQAYLSMGDAMIMAGDVKQSLDAFKKALELDPSSVDVHKGLLRAYKKLGLARESEQEETAISNIQNRQ